MVRAAMRRLDWRPAAGTIPIKRMIKGVFEIDQQLVKIAVTSVTVTEGSTADYTVVLTASINQDVTVNITKSGAADVTTTPTTLTFTNTTWGTDQTVTVSAAEDEDSIVETATLKHTPGSSDPRYRSGASNVTVLEVENDRA